MLHNQKATRSIRLTANFSSNICYNGNGHCQALSTRQIKQFAPLFLAQLKPCTFQIPRFWTSTHGVPPGNGKVCHKERV